MSMFTVKGQLLGIYKTRPTDRETGEQTEKDKVQLLGEIPVPEGDGTRRGLIDLTVQDVRPYKALEGKEIEVAVGFFSPAKGNVITFVPKGARPRLVSAKPEPLNAA